MLGVECSLCHYSNPPQLEYCQHCQAHLTSSPIEQSEVDASTVRMTLDVSSGSILEEHHLQEDNFAEGFSSVTRKTDPMLGQVLGNFRIVNKIGAGGFGSIYEVKHIHLDESFAVKIMKLGHQPELKMQERFQREAKALLKLKHENVVGLSDFGTFDNHNSFYLVMELLKGQSLQEAIKAQESFSLDRIGRLFKQICSMLHFAHSKGIVHRDLKPGNIFLVQDGFHHDWVKVLDFGIATMFDDEKTLTLSGMTLGSPYYLSPEQAKGQSRDVDGRADLYSLGIIFFQLLTGELPFKGSEIELYAQHMMAPPPILKEVFPQQSWAPKLQAFLDRAMAKQKLDRHNNAFEFWAECERALEAQRQLLHESEESGAVTVRFDFKELPSIAYPVTLPDPKPALQQSLSPFKWGKGIAVGLAGLLLFGLGILLLRFL